MAKVRKFAEITPNLVKTEQTVTAKTVMLLQF